MEITKGKGAKSEVASSERLSGSVASLDSVEVARQARVPELLLGDSTVVTLAEFPDVVPHPLARRSRSAWPVLPTTGRTIGSRAAASTRLGGRLVQDIELRADLRLTQDALEGSGARIVRRKVPVAHQHSGTHRARPTSTTSYSSAVLHGVRPGDP
jgi:hypothetical protein